MQAATAIPKLRIPARNLLKFSTEDLWEMLTGEFVLVFDDGELETNYRETLYSSYGWDFHRVYPKTPLLLKHHVRHILKNKRLGSDTHLTLLGNCMWSVYDAYIEQGIETPEAAIRRDDLAESVYKLTNVMYNDLSYRLEEYVTSLDIVDFINALEHPRIKEVNVIAQSMSIEEMGDRRRTEEVVNHAYEEIEAVLMTPGELPNNPIAAASQAKIVSMGQVLQCLGPRGYLTDTDSTIFQYPVMRGYVQGMRTLYNSLVESRSAAKSLLFSKTPLQMAEYFSRRLQLMSQVVRNLHPGDCGTTEYLMWTVKGPLLGKGGRVDYPGDLRFMEGKYYVADDGKLKILRSSDKHLIGKTLKLRSVLHCAHPDPYGICSTCFGELSLSVPESTNIGHMCCTSMTQESSQKVLSVKHLDGSSAVESLEISPNDRKYLKMAPDEISYMLQDRLKNKQVVNLVIPSERAANLTDVMEAKDVLDLSLSHVSELEEIGFVVFDGKIEEEALCFVHMGRRLASMTHELLQYIRQRGWTIDAKHNYVIDMTQWDWSKPILTLPLQHINMSDHSRDIAQMLESRVDDLHLRDKAVSPDAFLKEFFELVNDKLNVNLAVLEVILYAAMIRSAENFDYALPKPWTDRGLGVMKASMAMRSLSAVMAYEGHHDIITSAMSYVITNRIDHPMDMLVMPREVLEQQQRR